MDGTSASIITPDEAAGNASMIEEKKEEVDSVRNAKVLLRKGSSGYIRAHDLDIPEEMREGGSKVSSSKLHDTIRSQAGRQGPEKFATEGLFSMDSDLKLTLDKLIDLAFAEATDESSRFTPGRETANALRRRETQPALKPPMDPDWPIPSWQGASFRNLNEILIWNGFPKHKSFGHDWPLVKARGIVPAPPRSVANFLWESSNVNKYNNMSVGRYDGTVFQEGIDTAAADSVYGFPGCAKILKSYNKVKLVPRILEMVSILHARPLEPPMAVHGTYLIVNRSIWEKNSEEEEAGDSEPAELNATVNNLKNKLIRSEMLLGVQLLRPLNGGKHCEITTVTHAVVPGMKNNQIAKAAANVSAAKILRDIQAAYVHMK
jgi:hypothetical protein